MLVYRGTDSTSLADWLNNGGQWAGFTPDQYQEALKIVQPVLKQYGDNLLIAGHSLGGGLASYAALVTGMKTYTFNAAGLNPNNSIGKNALGTTVPLGNIDAYYVRGDILSTLQDLTLMYPAQGNRIGLTPDIGFDSYLKETFFGPYALKLGLDLHSMDSVIDALRLKIALECGTD